MCRLIAGLQLMGACGGPGVPEAREPSGTPSTIAAPAQAGAPPPPQAGRPATSNRFSQDTAVAMSKLIEIDVFATGPVGIRGSTSLGETITRELAQRADAIDAFTALADHHNPVTRLYAFWALRALAPDRAAAYNRAIMFDDTKVKTLHGCIVSHPSVGWVAQHIEDARGGLAQIAP